MLKNGDLTDDTFIQLEIALKQLQTESYELGKKHSKEQQEPPSGTQEKYFEPLIESINNFKI